jgi:hypothetical protein
MVVIPFLIAGLVGCEQLFPGGGAGDPVTLQTRLVGQASDKLDALISDMAELNARIEAAAVVDATLGAEWLTFMTRTWSPGLDDSIALIEELEASNLELEGMVAGQPAGAKPFVTEFVVAAAFLAGVSAWLLQAGNFTKAKVQNVERALETSRAQGKTQAQAIAENGPLIKQTMGDIYRDTQLRIAKRSLSPQFHKPPGSCGTAAVKLVVNGAKVVKQTKLLGKRKATRKLPQETEVGVVYLAGSDDGSYDSIPTGTWDLVVYSDDYVRGVARDVVIGQCTSAVPVDVDVMTLDEATGSPSTPDAGATGDFEVIGYRNTDGSIGAGAAGAEIQLSGSRTAPTISWTFGGAIVLMVTTQTGAATYGIGALEDDEGTRFPFASPVVYGNYAVASAEPLPQMPNPSPPLASGSVYVLTVAATAEGKVATLTFRPR